MKNQRQTFLFWLYVADVVLETKKIWREHTLVFKQKTKEKFTF